MPVGAVLGLSPSLLLALWSSVCLPLGDLGKLLPALEVGFSSGISSTWISWPLANNFLKLSCMMLKFSCIVTKLAFTDLANSANSFLSSSLSCCSGFTSN